MHIDFDPESKEIQIQATQSDLSDLKELILTDKNIIKCPLSELCAIFPFSSYLESVHVIHQPDQLVSVSVVNNKHLHIVGCLEKLKLLAEEIDSLSKHPQWKHIHLEYYPEHPFLDETSMAVIFQIKI